MRRIRLLILLGGALLGAAGAWADDVAFVDCSSHQEGTQVFGKPRRSNDIVAALPCGERFTVLLYGFIFSRIQTHDGKVGYIYSSLISVDRSGASVKPQSPATPAPAATPAAAPAMPAAQPATAVATKQPEPAPTPSAPPAQQTTAPASAPETNVATPQPAAAADAKQPEAFSDPVPATPQPAAASVAEAPPAEPSATPAAERQPVPAEPSAPTVQPANARSSWEKPNPGGTRRTPLVEAFGGYAFTRFDGGGTWTNIHGGMGSVGVNIKPWLQIVADTSYNAVTLSGTKNVVYGNHYGPRLFPRGRSRMGMRPFVEALFGGTRIDTSVSGTNIYDTSDSSFSMKFGGGLDWKLSRLVEVRVLNVDYYRTKFGGVSQNNYWASTGVVLRFFGGSAE